MKYYLSIQKKIDDDEGEGWQKQKDMSIIFQIFLDRYSDDNDEMPLVDKAICILLYYLQGMSCRNPVLILLDFIICLI